MELPTPPSFGPDRSNAYLEGTEGAPPRRQFVQALSHVLAGERPRALDVGCGPGRELVVMLREGYEVVGIDCSPQMIELARARVLAEVPDHADRLSLDCRMIEDAAESLRANEFQLVHAGFVLPFVPRPRFQSSLERLLSSIAPGGCFSGQFFGANDEFIRASHPDSMTSHSVADIHGIFRDFELISHEEVDRQGSIGRGVPKWWHVHHVIARKPARGASACALRP